jgi:hypothetical protein
MDDEMLAETKVAEVRRVPMSEASRKMFLAGVGQ